MILVSTLHFTDVEIKLEPDDIPDEIVNIAGIMYFLFRAMILT